ncbi:MAG TPA: YbaK/EbsC family protein [Anaerolineaceae bacterium]|nr:YbaK/EbsC family protein [Anaerolineaceae bacterium]
MITNNVTRLLDSRHIPYTAFELPVEKLGAEETASLLGVPISIVYKTIVAFREKPGKPILAVIPGNQELNLKAVAIVLKEKRVRLATQREAEQVTGLQAGGISPLALIHKGFTVLIDESAHHHHQIHISGGQRGLNIRLPVDDLADLTHARFAILCQTVSGNYQQESC